MSHLKSYVGSIVLAALLLQGCGSTESETTSGSTAQASAASITAENTINAINVAFADLDANSTDEEIAAATRKAKLLASKPASSTKSAAQAAGLLSPLTDKIKDGLVNVLDTNLGNKVTSAAFDVVLNSEGVTVVMLDQARKSHTITKVMIDALDADWSLTKKMIPMLQTNKEFGEKFAALAYEEPEMARFFFSKVDAPMYNALADAMLLSNDDAVHDESVEHSTTGYMGILMAEYATEYFVAHKSGANKVEIDGVKYAQNDANGDLATDDNFVNLLFNTGDIVVYDGNNTFEGHGDGTELTNEKFFYALFKTPDSTNSFIDAMDPLSTSVQTELMDNIFLGVNADANTTDTVQGYLNIISIGSAMYDGIYGVANAEGTRSGGYGFGSYSGAFIGFASLIPSDRYMTYAKAFMNAGYEYAKFHGINVWDGAYAAGKKIWDSYTGSNVQDSNTSANAQTTNAPARSAGLGLTGSDWVDDTYDIMKEAAYSISLSDILSSVADLSLDSMISTLNDNTQRVYGVFMYGKDENNNTVTTSISNPDSSLLNGTEGIYDDEVAGLHGLIELAVKEDKYYSVCGSRATNYTVSGYQCTNGQYSSLDDVNFTLPAFGDLTWSFAYNTATDGAMAYYDNNVDASWFADLSSNELVRAYFYPSADNIYIPSWMLAIDWLKAVDNYNTATIATTDFDFNAGYFDIYVTSTNPNILTAGSEIDLAQVVSIVKEINVTKVDMGSDSIIAVDENGTTIDGLNLYKVRTVSPEDTQAVLAYLSVLGDDVLTAIGLDSSNAAEVDTTPAP